MPKKLKIETEGDSFLLSATLVADHKAKKQAKGAMDPMITAYSIVYGEIFDEAMSDTKILLDWLVENMNWEDIKDNLEVEKGDPFSSRNMGSLKVSLVDVENKGSEE